MFTVDAVIAHVAYTSPFVIADPEYNSRSIPCNKY